LTGLLRPEQFFDGRMRLSPSASEDAFRPLCEHLGLDLAATASMTIHLANVKMANAVRLVSVREGHDPRRFAIVAFGGAGPLHACSVAEEIGISHVIVPRHPGAFSAVGLLSANLRRDFVRAWPVRLSAVSEQEFAATLAAFRTTVESEMAAVADGREVIWDCVADVRYAGQASELMVPVASAADGLLVELARRFNALHLAKFGYKERDAELEVMNLRLTGWAVVETAPLGSIPARTSGAPDLRRYPARLPGSPEIAFVERASLFADDMLQGPLVVTEPTATTFVPTGWCLRVDPSGNLDITHSRE
jgi:N-methylhydantoinase A